MELLRRIVKRFVNPDRMEDFLDGSMTVGEYPGLQVPSPDPGLWVLEGCGG
jgi:hypothetical protein